MKDTALTVIGNRPLRLTLLRRIGAGMRARRDRRRIAALRADAALSRDIGQGPVAPDAIASREDRT
ncbi:hypothetical protein [Salipiger sp.]|uniref:hypothetical protein n=1 Tax=Salipiger sp. TaxID=2078585 RepID=UPI003A98235B